MLMQLPVGPLPCAPGPEVIVPGAQVSKHLLMETMDSDILAAIGCVPNEEVWRKKEIKENTRANLTQRKCEPLSHLLLAYLR